MSSKQRVRRAPARQEPDRVPRNYRANLESDRALKVHIHLADDDHEGLRRQTRPRRT